MTNNEKNNLITELEVSLEDAQGGAGVTNLEEIETAIGAIRTAYASDPDTVTAANLVAAKAMIEGCIFSSVTSSSSDWNRAAQEAVTP